MSSASGIGFLKLLLGIVLFLALLALVDLRRLWASVAAADGLLLGCSLAAAGLVIVLEALRFQATFAGWGLRFGAALRITLASQFVGTFTPGAVGSELYKVYAVQRQESGMIRPFVKLAILRIIGALGVVVAAAASWLAAPERFRGILNGLAWRGPRVPAPRLALGGAALIALAVLAAVWSRLAPRLRKALQQGREVLAEIQFRLAGELFLLSLGVALLRGLSLVLLVRSVGQRASFGDLLVVAAFSVLASVLPISPAGLGVQEGVVAGCLVLLGVAPPAAVAVALINRAFLWLFAAVGGWVLAVSRKAPSLPAAGGP
ncbi:MAG TPA: lysylphosphatidylglycerol synthase transmembrane domain-containing protein [Thermoanaerobaculia bacterium]|nr:lysylphosphatidylglycerol synthase transmembrane domain-containing protein [Thermoanaerobaculia bacterium]